jgi:hypothetical protein
MRGPVPGPVSSDDGVVVPQFAVHVVRDGVRGDLSAEDPASAGVVDRLAGQGGVGDDDSVGVHDRDRAAHDRGDRVGQAEQRSRASRMFGGWLVRTHRGSRLSGSAIGESTGIRGIEISHARAGNCAGDRRQGM